MKKKAISWLLALITAAAACLSPMAPVFADETDAGTGSAELTQAPRLLVTEVATEQPAGKRFTYTELYNNSDEPVNFKDYTFYYVYENGLGNGTTNFSGKVFTKGSSYWTTGDDDIIIQPGKTLVLWQSDNPNAAGRSLADFNAYYGTDLVEGQDIVRIKYSGIHSTARRGYYFGKTPESIEVYAYSNEFITDDIPTGTEGKLAIQYAYKGNGIKCEKTGVSTATPGSVSADQVPAQRVHVPSGQVAINGVSGTAQSDGSIKVTAQIPYTGMASTAMNVKIYFREKAGDADTEYKEYKSMRMTASGDGATFTGTIPAEQIYTDEVKWYVQTGMGSDIVKSAEQTTSVTPAAAPADTASPLIITEVSPNSYQNDKNYTFFEMYNQSDEPIKLAAYNLYYYYGYPEVSYSVFGKIWNFTSLNDFDIEIEPGETIVCWLDNKNSTADDFNTYYGTDLELGQNLIKINYAGFHPWANRWLRIGQTESTSTVAGFNITPDEIIGAKESVKYAAPHGSSTENAAIPVLTSLATPGVVEDWQKSGTTVAFRGYENYPADDGNPPTLKVCSVENLPVPESINEGDELHVMYDVDLLLGATSRARSDAFTDTPNSEGEINHAGGNAALKNRPYIIGTQIMYKLDDAAEWTTIREQKQWRLGHYLMRIPSDILVGHSKVTFKVRSYSLYGMSETEENTVNIVKANDTAGMVRLNVHDDQILSGITTLTANDGQDNASTIIRVDGIDSSVTNMLENGAWFLIRMTGRNSYFKNVVTAPYGDNDRDIIARLAAWCEDANSRAIHVDNKYFTYNSETNSYDVTLSVWAGDSGTPFEDKYIPGENHEDMQVSGLKLKLANGREYIPTKVYNLPKTASRTNSSTDPSVWHYVGDSRNMSPRLYVSFSVPASEVNAVGTTLDTTTLTDGTHVVTAISGTKNTTARVIVDNTKPSLTVPVTEDSTIYDPVLLEEGSLAADANGLDSVEAFLDGSKLTLPCSIVPHDMAEGDHTLTVVAVDAAGNTSETTVNFKTALSDPELNDGNSKNITTTTAELNVNVGSDPADVTFYEGKSLDLNNGGVVRTDGQGSDASSTYETFPGETFSVKVGDSPEDSDLAVTWKGQANSVDETHPITLFAKNVTGNGWDKVAETSQSGEVTITGTLPLKDHVQNGEVTLVVQCATEGFDPDEAKSAKAEGDTSGSASLYSLSNWDGTSRPENYDFCFAWETDTQYYAESFPYHYDDMNKWIVDNRDDWKIRYVIHTGDIVDDCDLISEWENASTSMKIFDDAGIPYGILGGNHDVFAGREDYDNYWKYFGADRFTGRSYYGGSYKNNLGHYDLLTENGEDFIILYMSWDIYENEIDWMNEVLAKYPDRKAILCFHRYIGVSGSASNLLDYTGRIVQENVVANNPNVIAVLNGHYHGASIQMDCFDDDGDGTKERTVYQICTDYQSDPEGASEYIKFLYFDLKNNKVYVNSYSPYRNDYNYYDTPKLTNYEDGTHVVNQDIVELDFGVGTNYSALTRTLTTAGLAADVRTNEKIGDTKLNASGLTTQLWEGLTPDTQYGWYTKAVNGRSGISFTPVALFKTAELLATYEITAEAGGGGSISNAGTTSVTEGGDITYEVTPDAGYRVAEVLVDGAEAELTDGKYTFSNVTGNHTIKVTFEAIPQEQHTNIASLQAAVKYVASKDMSGYKAESLKTLNGLLDKADAILAGGPRPVSEQETIDKLAADIMDAYVALVESGEDSDSVTGAGTHGGSDNNGGNGGNGGSGVATSDPSNMAGYAVLALSAAAAAAAVIRKKREQHR